MRIAALYDIHGNLDALEAVLAEIESVGPDLVLVGGDVVFGPFPVETLDRLLAPGRPTVFIRGNADREVVTPSAARPNVPWAGQRDWVAGKLGAKHRALLAGLPTTATREVEGLGPTLFCHGTPRSDDEIVTRLTPEERLREILADVREGVVVGGHTHVQFDRRAAGRRVVNAGSVGMPYELARGAYWALLGPDVDLRRTAYDVDRAAERIIASGFPDAEEFVRKAILAPPSPDEASALFEGMATAARG